ncbi:hypothetical protein TVAG_336360 [Trichomonas vaginalis G3]|uniref:Pecanex C-terminal domain-containing protein n=1 Tax=Trichomonas vaginalis (strain ATCC PRA-98 / G3) TaxID=412133 RepID=A2FIN1_TRIV3|nr:pecanex family [Trichomonas vaginalis G3]EAX95241.1 hypothetical protein TVAG_336360 [Trichomonas vaginalis G3]KAI5503483.1 pecanex family [Trichomonas vaginalis G3]|eukprot:XP_001308171.1 hypothetical protein [Trichomonas vaginalis G3]
MKSKTMTLFLSLLIARKYFSIKPIIELQHMPKTTEHFISTYFVNADEMFKIPVLLFNSIFGNLFVDILSLNSIRIISSFKPSCFWDQWNEQDDEKLFEADLTEHPLETPVYISLSNYLEKNLGKLISSGKLGTVDSNDIFILTDKDLIAIIEIISRESYSVHFRLRGLEFNDVSPCHLKNRNIISDDLNMILQTDSFRNNVYHSLKLSRGPHHLIQSDLFFPVRSLVLYDFTTFFALVNEQTRENLKFVILVLVLKESDIFNNPEDYSYAPNNDDKFSFYLSKFGLSLSEADYEFANCIRYSIQTAIGINIARNNQLANLFMLLNNPQKFEIEILDYDNEKVRSIFVDFTRKYIASLMFATVHSCSEVNWSNPDVDFLTDFYHQAVDQFCPLPLRSAEFRDAFLNKKEVVVSDSKKNHDKFGIYMCSEENSFNFIKYNQLQAHSLWNYFAIMQLYYRCDDPESIVYKDVQCHMRNLFYTSASHPLGYPVYVSPILTSYYLPTFL